MGKKFRSYIPLGLIIVLMLVAYFSGFFRYLSFDSLKKHHLLVENFVALHPFLTPLLFILLYIVVIVLLLPGAIFLSLVSGYLFSQPWSTLYVIVAASGGAILLFLATRTAFVEVLRKKTTGPFFKKMKKTFQKNKLYYLLFVRFFPLFPFGLMNLVPAFFPVSLSTFTWTTLVGIIPIAFIFTEAGAGIEEILDTEKAVSWDLLLNMHMEIALVSLAIFSLLPLIIKYTGRK